MSHENTVKSTPAIEFVVVIFGRFLLPFEMVELFLVAHVY